MSTRKVFSEQRILGYSPQQVFSVAENINDYKLFLPWCLESQVLRREGPDRLYAKLVVGFGPLREEYTSCVTMARHHYLKVGYLCLCVPHACVSGCVHVR